MDIRVNMLPNFEVLMRRDPAVGRGLRVVAEKVARKVRAPARFEITTRAGIGPKGAFSQVIMTGDGALTEEFGSSSRPPKAPLRSALRGTIK